MRVRARSSVLVVVAGVVPALFGGPVFAAAMALLCGAGYREYAAMAARVGPRPQATGYVTVAAFAVAGLAGGGARAILGIVAATVGLPLVVAVFRAEATGAFVEWGLTAAGALYLGVPAYAAIALRQSDCTVDATWLAHLAEDAALGWEGAPRGLAWLVVVVAATWLCDTGAYLVGRAWGRRPLIPRVSPKKTVEGGVGGLVGAGLGGALGVWLFGLGIGPLAGLLGGVALGAIAQAGDLAESLLKRQAGVKDRGGLIPGHGGVLERVDALLFTHAAGWFVAGLADRVA